MLGYVRQAAACFIVDSALVLHQHQPSKPYKACESVCCRVLLSMLAAGRGRAPLFHCCQHMVQDVH